MTAPLLSARDLRIHSRAGLIVDGANLELRAGETIGLVGESGSGKSMTARALIGLLPPGVHATGQVSIAGVDVLRLNEAGRHALRGREISLMMQDPFTMLNPLVRVGRQLTETIVNAGGRRPSRDVRRAEAVRRLAEVGIRDESVVQRYPFQLSGGMRQRVGLASALASDPAVLIADEPSTALDVTTQREVLRLIRGAQLARGMGVVLITHDLRVAFSMCDRVYVLYAGSVVEVAASTALEEQPLHPYTLGLLHSEPPVDRRVSRLASIPGFVPTAESVRHECSFTSRCAWAVPAQCAVASPPLLSLGDGRQSACIRIGEISEDLKAARRQRDAAAASESASSGRPPVGAAAPLISVRSLSKSFVNGAAVNDALRNVTVSVHEGESVGIVGESGSGKTTLARCLVGLETPSDGAITIDGIDAARRNTLSQRERTALLQTVQMVFQDPYSSLNPARSIGFTLRETLRATDHKRSSYDGLIADLLERVGLSASYAGRKPSALSGGERQRVAIARALALEPKVLICDEPVSALDVSVQAQILNLFADLRATSGIGYVFITHDLAVVRQVAERLYVLHEGEVVEEGTTEAVLSAPTHSYTQKLLASLPRPDSDWLGEFAGRPASHPNPSTTETKESA